MGDGNQNSPIIAPGGDITDTTIEIGGEVRPAVVRSSRKPLFKTWWLGMTGSIGLIGSIMSIVGVSIGNYTLTGLASSTFAPMFSLGSETSTPGQASFTWAHLTFIIAILLFTASFGVLAELRRKGYIRLGFSRLIERYPDDGKLSLTMLTGVCPRRDGGRLKLTRVQVGTKTISKDGKPAEKPIKEDRLMCNKNKQDHVFRFDITRLHDDSER